MSRSRGTFLFLSLVLAVAVVGPLPRPIHALLAGPGFGLTPTIVVEDVPAKQRTVFQKLTDRIAKILKQTSDLAFKNGLRSFLATTIEKNLITIATGNPGQTPLFLSNPGKFFNDAATSSTLNFLDEVNNFGDPTNTALTANDQSVSVQRLARSVIEGNTPLAQCRTQCEAAETDFLSSLESAKTDLQRNQAIQRQDPNQSVDCTNYGLLGQVPVATCIATINDFIRTVQAQADSDIKACLQSKCANVSPGIVLNAQVPVVQGKSNTDALAVLNKYFRGTGSPIGQIGAIYTAALSAGASGEQAARDTQNSAVGPLLSTVTGEIRLPATGTAALLQQSILKATDAESIRTGSVLADAFEIFSKTLIARLRQNLLISPCGLNLALCKGPQTSSPIANLLFGSGGPTGIAGARLQFASIGKVDYRTGDPAKTPIQPTDLLQSQGLIDTQFRAAIDEKLTVKEALDKGLLDAGRTFGFDQNGKDPQDGYSYRAMVYLRKYRIVPVGWELAVLYNRDIDLKPQNLNLKQLTDAYAQCGQGICSNDGTVNCTPNAPQSTADRECGTGNTCTVQAVSPYCGLVDPDWVLKAPATFCKRLGAGEEIVSRQFVCDDTNGDGKLNCDTGGADDGHWDIQRATDACSDEQACIAENDDGSCRAYGYCVAERASFRFDGTSCPSTFASCTTYKDAAGTEASYLANTLDSRNCSAQSAGCQWYCKEPSRDPTGKWLCAVDPGTRQITGSTINFTSAVESCPADAAGCKRFLRTTDGANLLANSNAEYYGGSPNDGTADNFDPDLSGRGWTASGGAVTLAVTGDTPTGSTTALQLTGTGGITSTADTGSSIGDRTFVFSYAGRTTGAACSGAYQMTAASGGTQLTSATANYTDTWSRFTTAAFAFAPGTTDTAIAVRVDAAAGCTLLLDDLKLEEGPSATTYRDYGANAIHLSGTRTLCPVEAVGCQQYTPNAGGASVPGILRSGDRCPASSVGCRPFTELAVSNGADATVTDGSGQLLRGSRSLSLVPTTGTQCSAADVGCEEYTNLDTVAAGGEGREYFKQIRLCVKPGGTNTRTYYTWVGSDQVGFKLEAHLLKQSNVNAGPCSNLAFSGVGTPDPACVDTAASYPIPTCSSAADVATNPDCRQYYDEALNPYFRLETRTINVTASCRPYRNTVDETNNSSKVYTIDPTQSIACSAGAAQCRAYSGSAGSNTAVVLRDDFEDRDTAGWTGGTISNTAVNVGGHSMRVATGVYYDASTLVADGATYTVTFWAASDNPTGSTVTAYLNDKKDGSGTPTFAGQATLVKPDAGPTYHWNRFVLGPATFVKNGSGPFYLFLKGSNFFIDNIELTAVVDSVYLVRDTFHRCEGDENCAAYTTGGNQIVTAKSFSALCQEQFVGCEAVYDTQNSSNPFAETVFVRGQSAANVSADTVTTLVNDPRKYCSASNDGCSAFGRPALDLNGVVASTSTVFLKDNPDAYPSTLCLATELFCKQFTTDTGSAFFKDPGLQVCEYIQPTGLPQGWYRRGTTQPCSVTSVSGTTYTDQEPDRCEVRIINGTEQFCYRSAPDGVCVPCATRICSGEFNGCTEYLDPRNPAQCQPSCAYRETNGVPLRLDASCRPAPSICAGTTTTCLSNSNCTGGATCQPSGLPGCRGYYQLKQTVNATDCNGVVDAKQGCLPFNDTSGGTLNLRSSP